jgi:hypothetical protein
MQCPKKAAQQQSGPSALAKQNVSQPGAGNCAQIRYNHGRLNHLEAEAVQETPDMIVGMFPVDSHITEVLFDTGAMHSFITVSWVEAHNLPLTTMSTPIQIDSAGRKVRTDSIFLNVSMEIRGIAFPANLIVMGTQGIDVILGMNWLDKYQAIISCDKRTIKLVSPLGEEVVAELVSPEPRKGGCHQMAIDSKDADSLETIKVVSEFPDVFPKDLPGMPPERKVEFAIELLPGTAPFLRELTGYLDQTWLNSRSRSMSCQRKVTLGQAPRLGPPLSYSWRRKMTLGGCVSIIELLMTSQSRTSTPCPE